MAGKNIFDLMAKTWDEFVIQFSICHRCDYLSTLRYVIGQYIYLPLITKHYILLKQINFHRSAIFAINLTWSRLAQISPSYINWQESPSLKCMVYITIGNGSTELYRCHISMYVNLDTFWTYLTQNNILFLLNINILFSWNRQILL